MGDEGAAAESEPTVAAELFGDRIDLARRFTRALIAHGVDRGLIGPDEVPRLWTRHVLNSVVAAELFTTGSRVGDVGSGAGLPGLVLAIARPDVQWVLIEPMERRVAWLREQSEELGLENVVVVRARAEEAGLEGTLDQVTARAVSALRKLIPWTAPLVRDGGELMLFKGVSVQGEIESARKQIFRFRLSEVRVQELGADSLAESTRVLRARVRA